MALEALIITPAEKGFSALSAANAPNSFVEKTAKEIGDASFQGETGTGSITDFLAADSQGFG